MEKGLLFIDEIDRRESSCTIDMSAIQKLKSELKAGLKNLEKKRQNGFYIQVDVKNGLVIKSPNNIAELEIKNLLRRRNHLSNLVNHCVNSSEIIGLAQTEII
jgi:hypothetical protein